MEKLVCRIWDNVEAGANVMKMNDKSIELQGLQKKKKTFETEFMNLYEKINEKYMLEDTESLDRHKVAAIIMISIIKSEILSVRDKESQNKTFLGNYILATDCGFSYMLKELNIKLGELEQKEIKKFFFPEAMACETNYYRIFYRNLYFADSDEDWGLNPLDIAERLFLLEYVTLEKNDIDPSILKEY